MKSTLFGAGLGLLLFCTTATAQPKKVVLIVFENTNYTQALAQPFFAKFANQGVLLTNFYAIGHPSQPNYVAMIAGSDLGVGGDTNVTLNDNHLGDLLEAKGLDWHVYAESFPGNCFLGAQKKPYYRKHNPFISFTNVSGNSTRCAKITDATAFASDFKAGKLPEFSMYIPDINNDGHDTGSAYADNWFSKTMGPLLQDPVAMQGVMFVAVFDEDDNGPDNHIYAAMYGPDLKAGTQISTRYDHVSMLRTIEDLFQIGNLGKNDATQAAITGFLK